MKNFNGADNKESYFEGWYLKHTNGQDTISFIPGISIDSKGEKQAFIQVITNHASYNVNYGISQFRAHPDKFRIQVGSSKFSEKGIVININSENLKCHGFVKYNGFTPLKYDAMGPFAIFPSMECNHGVVSLFHKLQGEIYINGKIISLYNGTGYIEKDWGSSFPTKYLWTHFSDMQAQPTSVMISIATIPFLGCSFTGCICVVYAHGREHRIATYLGARVIEWSQKGFLIKQGAYTLKAFISSSSGQKLFAPKGGSMDHIIRQSSVCEADFKFYYRNRLILDKSTNSASAEFVQ